MFPPLAHLFLLEWERRFWFSIEIFTRLECASLPNLNADQLDTATAP